MNISDLTGLSKPLTRLVEVVSEGVGAVSRPYLIRKIAHAKADEAKIIASALKEIAEEQNLPVIYKEGAIEVWQKPSDRTLDLNPGSEDTRILDRVGYEERKQQNNLERITSIAAEDLTQDEDVPEEKPDEDWVSRFFGSAKDVSSDEMQTLWGRILSGEIRRPGSFSLRTLEFVRNISKSDAGLIEKLGGLAVNYGTTAFVFVEDQKWLSEAKDLFPGHHFAASEIGAMFPSKLNIQAFKDKETEKEVFIYGDLMLLVGRNEISGLIPVPIWKFTAIGVELIQLIPKQEDEKYLNSLGQKFVKQKGKVFLAKIKKRLPNGQVEYDLIGEVVADDGEA